MFGNLLANTKVDWLRLEQKTAPKFAGKKIGDVVTAVIPVIFTVAGLIMLFYLIWAGFQYMTSAGDPKAMQTAKTNITYAVIGFLVIFSAYWVVSVLALIFGLRPVSLIFTF